VKDNSMEKNIPIFQEDRIKFKELKLNIVDLEIYSFLKNQSFLIFTRKFNNMQDLIYITNYFKCTNTTIQNNILLVSKKTIERSILKLVEYNLIAKIIVGNKIQYISLEQKELDKNNF